MGEHSINKPLKFKWYGAFNILDGYVPDQRRILYYKNKQTQDPFRLLISQYAFAAERKPYLPEPERLYLYRRGDLTRTICADWARTNHQGRLHVADQRPVVRCADFCQLPAQRQSGPASFAGRPGIRFRKFRQRHR